MKLLASQWLLSLELEGARYLGAAILVSLLLILLGRGGDARRIQRRRPRLADRWQELRRSIGTLGVFALTGVLIFALVRAHAINIVRAPAPWWRLALEFGAIALAHDTYFYWMHRALHSRLLFRRTHATHHRFRTPTPWAAYSFSVFEGVTESIFLPLFMMLLPMHRVAILAFLIHQIARNAVGHCGHELFWPGFTRARATGWLTTTTHHDLHHSEGRCNYGLYFTWWDRWMGTEHPRYHQKFEAAAKPWFGRAAPDDAVAA